MDQQMTALSDIDPMLDDAKFLVRVVRIRKSHLISKPNEIWSLEVLFQDQQVINITMFSLFLFISFINIAIIIVLFINI